MRPWEEIFTGIDREVLQVARMGRKLEYGKKPALLIIDVTESCVGPNKPILEAIKEVRAGCGETGWKAIAHIQKLQQACRDCGVPIIYSIPDFRTRLLSGILPKGRSATEGAEEGAEIDRIVEPIAPLDSELVIYKIRPSIFFGTPLITSLRAMKIDSLLLAGTTTSGCVRAAAVDTFSHYYPCFVIEECTFDRFQLSHLVNLFDINAKYGTVISLEEALRYINELRQK